MAALFDAVPQNKIDLHWHNKCPLAQDRAAKLATNLFQPQKVEVHKTLLSASHLALVSKERKWHLTRRMKWNSCFPAAYKQPWLHSFACFWIVQCLCPRYSSLGIRKHKPLRPCTPDSPIFSKKESTQVTATKPNPHNTSTYKQHKADRWTVGVIRNLWPEAAATLFPAKPSPQ